MEKKSLKERINEIHDFIVESIKDGRYSVKALRIGQNYAIFTIVVEDAKVSIGVSSRNGVTYYSDDIIQDNVENFFASTDPVGKILTSEHLTTGGKASEAVEGGEQC